MELYELLERMPLVPFIRQCGYAVRRPWFLYDRRLLDYLLIYVQEGQLAVMAEGEEWLFEKGQFCLLQPGCLHSLRGLTNTVTPFAHFDLFYHPQRKESFPTRPAQVDLTPHLHLMQPRLNDIAGIDVPVRLALPNPLRFRDLFMSMIEAGSRQDPLSQLEAQSQATELALALLQAYAPARLPAGPSESSLQWMSSYLHFHLADPLTVEQMAQRASLSPSRFRALFKAQFGMAPHQYLLQLRLRHARELLQQTDHTMQEIAAYCGFADTHHFVKAFKKATGQPPGQYRSAWRSEAARLKL